MSNKFSAKSLFVRWLCRGALTVCLMSALMAQNADSSPQARVLVTQPIDSTRLHKLAGNTRAEANSRNDRGRVADTFAMNHMLLQLQRSPEREQALETFIDQQHTASSPNFHKWLTAVEFGRLYGPAEQDIDTVSRWLSSSGFSVNTVYPSGMSIDFSGTAGQVLAAFHTEIHKLSVDGKDHVANISDPEIPEALAPVVSGIVSLHDFRPRSMVKPRVKYTASQGNATFQAVVPADLATIYDFNPAYAAGYTGKGQTIVLLEDTELFSASDWNTFRQVFGLSTYTSGSLSTIFPAPPTGSSNCSSPGTNQDDNEAALDVEWSSAAAPDATIVLAACSDTGTTSGILIGEQNLVNGSSPPQIISNSYGFCEAGVGATMNAALNSTAQQAVAEGVSLFVAAGDEGAAECDGGLDAATHGIGVDSSASTPYAVAAGGTDFADSSLGTNNTYWSSTNSSTFGSALSYIPEIPWNDSCAGSVVATFMGFSVGYGPSGLCGSEISQQDLFYGVAAGSGGPSGCATGVPAENLVVGGTCQGYPKPSWQTGVAGIPNDGVRDLPDVSMFASNGFWGHFYLFCFSDIQNGGAACDGAPINWAGAGGTSFASPILAGIQALVNQKMGGPQGNPNPVYYKLAASSVASSVFHSITTGDNAVNCSGDVSCFGNGFVARGRATPSTEFNGNGALSTTSGTYTPAFAATAGWNFATGLGSVDAYNLIINWTKGQ
jgi:subtilase family serine protease